MERKKQAYEFSRLKRKVTDPTSLHQASLVSLSLCCTTTILNPSFSYLFASSASNLISFSAKGHPQCRTNAIRVGVPECARSREPIGDGAVEPIARSEEIGGEENLGRMDCRAGR